MSEAAIFYNKGTKYNDEGKYSLAVDNFLKALSIEPDNIMAYFNLGVAYMNKKEPDSALESFNHVLRLNPDEVAALSNIALIYSKKKEYSKSTEYYLKVLELEPEDIDSFKELADVYVKSGRYDEAIEYYRKVLKANPCMIQVKESIKTALNLKKSSPLPVEVVMTSEIRAEEKIKENAEDYFNLAVKYTKEQNFPSAIENFRKCLQLKPLYPNAFNILDKLLKLETSITNTTLNHTEPDPGITKNTAKPDTYINYIAYREALALGIAFFNTNNYNPALEKFNQCREINPYDTEALDYLNKIRSENETK